MRFSIFQTAFGAGRDGRAYLTFHLSAGKGHRIPVRFVRLRLNLVCWRFRRRTVNMWTHAARILGSSDDYSRAISGFGLRWELPALQLLCHGNGEGAHTAASPLAANANQIVTNISTGVDVRHAKQPHVFEAAIRCDSDNILGFRQSWKPPPPALLTVAKGSFYGAQKGEMWFITILIH